MYQTESSLLVVNFGGPRNLKEIEPFLKELLTDGDVIKSGWPKGLQDLLFKRIARKRAKRLVHDYASIGGKSPIFEDTEVIAKELGLRTNLAVMTFHRYLTDTHPLFYDTMLNCQAKRIIVFPLFPQFSYSTTGSIARFFSKQLPSHLVKKMRWIKSYAAHKDFIDSMQKLIRNFLNKNQLSEEQMVLFFSAHGLPKAFIDEGDIYEDECERSFLNIARGFPKALCRLGYQSRFGKQEWIRPYTEDLCQEIHSWRENRDHILMIPLSFTSDHIETLFEIENMYLPVITKQGLSAFRLPALGLDANWLDAACRIIKESDLLKNEMLFRR